MQDSVQTGRAPQCYILFAYDCRTANMYEEVTMRPKGDIMT